MEDELIVILTELARLSFNCWVADALEALDDEVQYAMQAIEALIVRKQKEARISEQNHLGFDKRLDNPILYCEGDRTISQDERLKQLRSALPPEKETK